MLIPTAAESPLRITVTPSTPFRSPGTAKLVKPRISPPQSEIPVRKTTQAKQTTIPHTM